MPNWCDTTYKCIGDPKEVGELAEIVKNIFKYKSNTPNGFGDTWLGILVEKLGFKWEDKRCRGEMTDYDYDGESCLTIYQCTAWCEQNGVREAIEEKYPSIKVYWQDQEPGCENYCTNDDSYEFFPERYILEGGRLDYKYFDDLDDLKEYLEKELNIDTKDKSFLDLREEVSKVCKARVEENDDHWVYIHEFTVIND